MGKEARFLRFDLRLIAALIVYIVLGLLLFGHYRYQINPDGISYISLARKYLAGDFRGAVNGYWGPLFAWLLAPFLYFISDGLLAGKVLCLFIGVAALVGLWLLSYRFDMPQAVRATILFTAVPVVLSFAFADLTPDILLTAVLLFYFTAIFSDRYGVRLSSGVVCGVFGGAAYLSKSFGFPFFVSHFLLMNVLHFVRAKTRESRLGVARNFFTGVIVFCLIGGVWVALISNKYGRFTFGTSAGTTYGASAAGGRYSLGVYWQGFLEPPNATALSIWEDPSYLESPPREESGGGFLKNQLKVTAGLIGQTAKIFMGFSVLSVVIFVVYVLWWIRKLGKGVLAAIPCEVLFPTVTVALLAGGYSLVWVQERYLWVLCLLMMLMGGYVLACLFEYRFFTKAKVVKAVVLFIFFASFVFGGVRTLKSYSGRGGWVHDLAGVLKQRILPQDRIASNTNWAGTLFLSYHLNCKYYGMPKQQAAVAELKKDLEKYRIDYYFVWGDSGEVHWLSAYPEITGGRMPGLRIYSLKQIK